MPHLKVYSYLLHGQIVASDFIESHEVENYLEARIGRKKPDIIWDHSVDLIHSFTIKGIDRTDKEQELTLNWDGNFTGVKQKGSLKVIIPEIGKFTMADIINVPGESQRIDLVFSDPLDVSQEMNGLIYFSPCL